MFQLFHEVIVSWLKINFAFWRKRFQKVTKPETLGLSHHMKRLAFSQNWSMATGQYDPVIVTSSEVWDWLKGFEDRRVPIGVGANLWYRRSDKNKRYAGDRHSNCTFIFRSNGCQLIEFESFTKFIHTRCYWVFGFMWNTPTMSQKILDPI